MKNNPENKVRSTTVLGVIHNGMAALGADGQVTVGSTILKNNVRKIRLLSEKNIMTGFAGGTADAFTLLDRFEEKLSTHNQNMRRSAIELAKDWRSDRYLRHLEAMLVVMNKEEGFIISGMGDVVEPDYKIFAIGSGGMYAYSAALALLRHSPNLSAKEIVKEALIVAGDVCIYTNQNHEILTIE